MKAEAFHISRRDLLGLLTLGCGLVGPSVAQISAIPTPRPARWAQPVAVRGVHNLHRITDQLYRSQQPSREGMKRLSEMGIKTVINLRAFHSDRHELEGTGLINAQLHVKTWHIEDEDVITVLRLLRQTDRAPFLIHCQHGADRTGLMSAMFRIIEQGWSKEAAIDEMVNGGFGFHAVWQNIPRYLMAVDVEKMRQAMG